MLKDRGSNLLALVIFLILCGAVLVVALPIAAEDARLVQGVQIGPHQVGELDNSAVQDLLDRDNESLETMKLSLRLEEVSRQNVEIPYAQLGISLDRQRIWQEAYQVGRVGNWWQRWRTRWQVKRKGLKIPLYFLVDKEKALQRLTELTDHLLIPAQDARIMVTPKDRIEILPEVPGKAPDLDRLLSNLEKELTNQGLGSIQINLEYRVLSPAITARDLTGYKITGLLSSFSTSYNPQKTGRSNNIFLATNAVEGIIIPPGQIFSFNKVVGPRTRDRGYDEADIILNNELVPDLGGGVCQVSSTLYNAVLRARLEIVERSPHSLLIGYVEPGLDATVAYGSKDFSFRNNTAGHILIKCSAKYGTVSFKIFGLAESKPKVILKSIKEQEVLPKTIYLNDPLVPQGDYILEKNGAPGIYIRVERYTYHNSGELLSKEIISRDYYPPVNRVIRTSTDSSLLSIDPNL